MPIANDDIQAGLRLHPKMFVLSILKIVPMLTAYIYDNFISEAACCRV